MVVFDMKFLQQNLEMILCRQADIGQISAHPINLGD